MGFEELIVFIAVCDPEFVAKARHSRPYLLLESTAACSSVTRLTIPRCSQPTSILTRLDVHPCRRNDIVYEAPFKINADADAPPVHRDVHGNMCRRLTACPGDTAFELSGLMVDAGIYEAQLSDEPAWPSKSCPRSASSTF